MQIKTSTVKVDPYGGVRYAEYHGTPFVTMSRMIRSPRQQLTHYSKVASFVLGSKPVLLTSKPA